MSTKFTSVQEFKDYIKSQPGWRHLSLTRVDKAMQMPPQSESWSCGPNSAYRALILSGDKTSGSGKELGRFIEKCPKSFGIAGRFGASKGDIGPVPSVLAKYTGQKSDFNVKRDKFGEWQHFWKDICGDIDSERPVILLLQYSLIRLHYVNFIGYNNNVKEVAILDTKQEIKIWSKNKFRQKTRITALYIDGRRNTIRFC